MIARWDIERFESGANALVGQFFADPAIPRPGTDPFSLEYQSEASYQTLADGSLARFSQEHKANLRNIEWRFSYPRTIPVTVIDKLFNQLKEYERLDKGVRITLHTGDKIKGHFLNVRKVWRLQGSTQTYDVFATFQAFDLDNQGFIITGSSLYV